MWIAAWVQARRGVDPAAEWRGRYRTPLGLARIIRRRGGMAAHFDQCLKPLGIARTDAPRRGDIAVVKAPEGDMGAIILGPTWRAVLERAGPAYRTAPIIAAWSV